VSNDKITSRMLLIDLLIACAALVYALYSFNDGVPSPYSWSYFSVVSRVIVPLGVSIGVASGLVRLSNHSGLKIAGLILAVLAVINAFMISASILTMRH
jgi:hypothetical protein